MSEHISPRDAENVRKAVAMGINGGETVVVGDERKEEFIKSPNLRPLDLDECR